MIDPLDEALGLPPIQRSPTEIIVPDTISSDHDYEFARQNMYRLLTKGEDMLDELSDIARISQHPRSYEVLSGFFKTLVDANKDLLGLKKTLKDIHGVSNEDGPKTVNQTLIMTSDEVLKMIKEKNAS